MYDGFFFVFFFFFFKWFLGRVARPLPYKIFGMYFELLVEQPKALMNLTMS